MQQHTHPQGRPIRQHPGRIPVIAIAILFLTAALLSALPSAEEWNTLLHRNALAGFESSAESTRSRPPILGEYYDTPVLPQTEPPTSTTAPTVDEERPSHQTKF